MDGQNSIWLKKAKPDGLNEKGAKKVPKALAPKENQEVAAQPIFLTSLGNSGRRERI